MQVCLYEEKVQDIQFWQFGNFGFVWTRNRTDKNLHVVTAGATSSIPVSCRTDAVHS